MPCANRPDVLLFDEAIARHLRGTTGSDEKPLRVSRDPVLLDRIERLLHHRLRLKFANGDTGLADIRRDIRFRTFKASERYLVRVEKNNAKSSPDIEQSWVPRVESEVKLHVLLQSRIAAAQGKPSFLNDALSVRETKAYKPRGIHASSARPNSAATNRIQPIAMPATAQDPFDLNRFIEAQAVNYADAIAELRAGRKQTHWAWYVLPQIDGLGSSSRSARFALSGLDEARAYLDHPTLGPRLRECVAAMNAHGYVNPESVLGAIDARKFHSCITLFARVAERNSVFHHALNKYFQGIEDADTLAILARHATPPTT
ncbi:MAG TPA: DUF1810 domain-containing protein [Burkholderiaceae bacterium]|nr:DUF1810 domain-containing protein [Burkholderiaceae bacterium]